MTRSRGSPTPARRRAGDGGSTESEVHEPPAAEDCRGGGVAAGPAAGWQRGLTLVELLVAMSILVVLSASTALMFRGITRAWRMGELRTERYQQARLLFDLFGRELSSCVANPRYPMLGTSPADPTRVRQDSRFSELFFVGTIPGRTGLVERGYWVSAQGDLMCHDQEPADGVYATGASELCGRDVSRLSVSYFDGTDWLDRWDGRAHAGPKGLLPKAIRITLMIGREKPEQFDTVVSIPTS